MGALRIEILRDLHTNYLLPSPFNGEIAYLLSDPALVPRALLSALGALERQAEAVDVALVDYPRPRSTLIVLDNCEHLVAACAELVDALLRACPSVRVLATSREPLRVEGEALWRVPSLAAPARGDAASATSIASYSPVQLFVDRARLVESGFEPTNANAAAVAQICGGLDGISLALELAPARLRVPVQHLAARLDDHLSLLGRGRTAPTRQQTLRATLDWSFALLAESERTLLRRLGVVAGGCTFEAAQAVCAWDALLTREVVLDALAALVDKSLAMVDAKSPDRGIACSNPCGNMRRNGWRRQAKPRGRAAGTANAFSSWRNGRCRS